MSEQPVTGDQVTRILTAVANDLSTNWPDDPMAKAARVGRVCQFTPGESGLAVQTLAVVPPQCTRREYAATLRAVDLTSGLICCGKPMQPQGSQLVCSKCGSWFQGGDH